MVGLQSIMEVSGVVCKTFLEDKEKTCSVQLSEALQQLSDIITSFEASYEATDDGSGEAEFAPILAAVTDPWIETVHHSSEALKVGAPSRSVGS